jgi:hypothetical protein
MDRPTHHETPSDPSGRSPAYSVDPLSGAGIRRSIETAAQGANAADAFLAGDPPALDYYAAWASVDFEHWLARKDDVYAEVDPDLRKGAFWRRRIVAGPAHTASAHSSE